LIKFNSFVNFYVIINQKRQLQEEILKLEEQFSDYTTLTRKSKKVKLLPEYEPSSDSFDSALALDSNPDIVFVASDNTFNSDNTRALDDPTSDTLDNTIVLDKPADNDDDPISDNAIISSTNNSGDVPSHSGSHSLSSDDSDNTRTLR